MSALPRSSGSMLAHDVQIAEVRPLSVDALDQLMPIEMAAYEFPWTRGNFVDSLAVGHQVDGLFVEGKGLVAYFVAMQSPDELHLLNLTVANGEQGQGYALRLLDALAAAARSQRVERVWLEVRRSNERAKRIYERYGFSAVGLRKGYYPASADQREDALVMSLELRYTEVPSA